MCRASQPCQEEFWPPCCADALLLLTSHVARKAAWLHDQSLRAQYAAAAPQVHQPHPSCAQQPYMPVSACIHAGDDTSLSLATHPCVWSAVSPMLTEKISRHAMLTEHAVIQPVLANFRGRLERLLKTAQDFRDLASESWAPRVAAYACAAHHVQHSLREATGALLLLDVPSACLLCIAGCCMHLS